MSFVSAWSTAADVPGEAIKSQLPLYDGARRGSADSAVIGFHSWILVQCKKSVDANSGLFKETDDAALDQNLYEIRFCG